MAITPWGLLGGSLGGTEGEAKAGGGVKAGGTGGTTVVGEVVGRLLAATGGSGARIGLVWRLVSTAGAAMAITPWGLLGGGSGGVEGEAKAAGGVTGARTG